MKNKVFVYCRKSQEDEERQALSIPSQIEALEKLAKRDGYNLIKPYYQESQSAKKPGRPIFNQMVKDIESQQVKSVLVWNPDRLSRNSVDSGQIIYMMDRGLLDEIITPAQVIRNTPNDKFLFSILCGQAKLENDNRGINAKRGMSTKANMGWMPSSAPLGYKNTPDRKKGFKIIIKDEERFYLVKRLFTEILKGRVPLEVFKEAVDVWKLTTQQGKIISRSTFYNILNKTFYYGEFEYPKGSNVWFKGQHEPMITKEEFDMVQKALGKYGKPVQHSHTFDLTGLFRCQVCGCAITATQKTKYYKGTGRIATYTYYHCTKKNKNIKCTSKPLTEADILNQIDNLLNKITPDQDFVDWSNKWLKVIHQDESIFREEILKSQQIKLSSLERKLNNLLDMKLDESIEETVYKQKKEKFEKEKNEIKAKIDIVTDELDDWRTKVENTIQFARVCRYKFNNGSREDKQMILMNIGANLILNSNKLLEIKLKPEFEVLADKENWGEKYKGWLEPQNYTEIMANNDDLRPANPVWLPLKDLFCNHKLEFDISLNDLKIAFDEMGLKQPRLAFATSA